MKRPGKWCAAALVLLAVNGASGSLVVRYSVRPRITR